ncbi:MAG: heme exporter protein CcmD [Telmatospirillum sp.]|nr:heme exporter protein CcmD [Telmatospirillum sp.]
MDALTAFFDMGGYARFIWPAYGLVTLVALGLLVTSGRALRSRERELAQLQERNPGRRGRIYE